MSAIEAYAASVTVEPDSIEPAGDRAEIDVP